jgi:hypothetical protein
MGMRAVLMALGAVVMLAVAGGAQAQTSPGACDRAGPQWSGPAFANAISVYSLEWSPFGQPEMGWETYLPLIQRELGTDCAPGTAGVRAALAEFQFAHALTPTGWFDAADLPDIPRPVAGAPALHHGPGARGAVPRAAAAVASSAIWSNRKSTPTA